MFSLKIKLIFVGLILVSVVALAYAKDTTLNNSISIFISKQCKTMIVNDFPTNCPDYQELEALNLDTSNRMITGEFGFKDGLYLILCWQSLIQTILKTKLTCYHSV